MMRAGSGAPGVAPRNVVGSNRRATVPPGEWFSKNPVPALIAGTTLNRYSRRDCGADTSHRPRPATRAAASIDQRLDQRTRSPIGAWISFNATAQPSTSPPPVRDPAQEPNSRQGKQDEVDLTLFDVAADRFERQSSEHQQHRELPVIYTQGPQNAEEKDSEACVQNDHCANNHQVAVQADRRLKQPGQGWRRDVLRARRLQTTHRLAEVLWVLARVEAARGPHVARCEVAQIAADDDWQNHVLPDAEDGNGGGTGGQRQSSKAAIVERRAPCHARDCRGSGQETRRRLQRTPPRPDATG